MQEITKVVMPVAGLGTRSLPASKTIPKEMLPVFNKPVIHYIVEECLEAGLKDVVFITGKDKTALEDYFDHNPQLESLLEKAGKTELLGKVKEVAELINMICVRQKQQLGLGHAVLCAEKAINNEAFGVTVGDDIITGNPSGMKQLIDVAKRENMPAIAVIEVDPKDVCKYGIVAGNMRPDGNLEITDMVEKPAVGTAPSNWAIIGRYVLTPEIFTHLHNTKPGHGGEIQLTDALKSYAKERPVLAVPVKGIRFDAGNWEDYLTAGIYFGLRDENLKASLKARLEALLREC